MTTELQAAADALPKEPMTKAELEIRAAAICRHALNGKPEFNVILDRIMTLAILYKGEL